LLTRQQVNLRFTFASLLNRRPLNRVRCEVLLNYALRAAKAFLLITRSFSIATGARQGILARGTLHAVCGKTSPPPMPAFSGLTTARLLFVRVAESSCFCLLSHHHADVVVWLSPVKGISPLRSRAPSSSTETTPRLTPSGFSILIR
jgi:hypothetical protein